MTTAGGDSRPGAERAFFAAINDLYLRAGRPSSRAVATAIGGISHTTVNSVVKGTKVPSWPITVKIVEHLNGDVEIFRQLWVETQERLDVEPAAPRAEVSVFVSYARVDDEATHGRISQLTTDIANTYRSMTGQVVGVFKDVDSIAPGEDWKDRIRLGLSSSSVFLAFVSPAYLRSAACREELSEFIGFLNANSSTRLIIPLVFAKLDRIKRAFSDDDLWNRLSDRNRVDISELRSADIGSSVWIQAVEKISDQIDEVLTAVASLEGSSQPAPTIAAEAEADDGEGHLFDRLARLEDKLPEITVDLESFAKLMADLGSQTEMATPRMQKATSFGQKLAVSKHLAEVLSPIANDMQARADRLVENFGEWGFLVNYVFEKVKVDSDGIVDEDNIAFLNAVREMSESGAESLAHVDNLNASVATVLGFSKALDIPLKTVRAACLRMADLRGLLVGWLDEIRALESVHPELLKDV
ncbi:toll/interleukin-1 receptor domain-containing protein [Micromonospora sp. NPDC005254]|uniref:toll/interleukin-1 receptor domain-containing protein n=1 Tax=Micromonospora sp. NPDC005254 TaxID=3364229 RepID=UPI0036828D9B